MLSPSNPFPTTALVEDEPKITVKDVEYLLIPHHYVSESVGWCLRCDPLTQTPIELLDFGHGPDATLAVVYLVDAGQSISADDLRCFRSNVLDKDDVFQPEFCLNVVFYGHKAKSLKLQDEARHELLARNTKSWTFVNSTSSVKVALCPYVSMRGKTWQPWRIYLDFNATLMYGFKPSRKDPGR